MKKILKIVVIIAVLAFIGIQFVRPDFTNPPVDASQTLAATMQVPENVTAILNRSCADCHSNETKYPWYSKIQPSAYFLKDHIDEGRKELNLSVWKTYEPRRQRRKLGQMCEQVKSAEMPLPSYLWIHGDAKMSAEDVKTLCDWTEAESARLKD